MTTKITYMNDEAFKIVIEAAQAVTKLNQVIGSPALENLATNLYESIAECIDESECEECECEDCSSCSGDECEECEIFTELHGRIDDLEQEVDSLKQIIIGLQYKLNEPTMESRLLVTRTPTPTNFTFVFNE